MCYLEICPKAKKSIALQLKNTFVFLSCLKLQILIIPTFFALIL